MCDKHAHNVIGGIAILWEWSKFDHRQNPNPLTDYNETLRYLVFVYPDSPTEVTRGLILTQNGSKHTL